MPRSLISDVAPAAMIEFFSSALVTFLVIIDPPGCAPIFSILTQRRDRRAAARDGGPLGAGRLGRS